MATLADFRKFMKNTLEKETNVSIASGAHNQFTDRRYSNFDQRIAFLKKLNKIGATKINLATLVPNIEEFVELSQEDWAELEEELYCLLKSG